MKKMAMVAITLIASLSTFAQTMNVTTYYGSTKKLGLEFKYIPNDIIFGAGVTMGLDNGGVGSDYTGVVGPNAFGNEIYKTVSREDIGIYGIVGYKVTNDLIVNLNAGYGSKRKYYNGYDRFQILSPSGYYYVSVPDGGTPFFGGSIDIKITKLISVSAGYDTFNKGKVGVGINF